METGTKPRERPILFSAPMVRAILAGRKTQTRRIIKPQPSFTKETIAELQAAWPGEPLSAIVNEAWQSGFVKVQCPHGDEGDRLWVRETWQAWNRTNIECDEWEAITPELRETPWAEWFEFNGRPDKIEYRADSKSTGPWTPSIHMPRWASRITLEITEVRVERLRDISEEDARAEGVEKVNGHPERGAFLGIGPCHREGFAQIWSDINGEGSWDANPWIWAITFRRLQ